MENTVTKIFGLRAIIEAINSDNNLEKVYLQKDAKVELSNELKYLIRKKIFHIVMFL